MTLPFALKAQYTVSYPIDRSVYQRDNSGYATIPISGHFPVAACSGYTAEYKIDNLYLTSGDFYYTHTGWTTFYPSSLGVFHFTVSLTTGWYYVYVRLKENSSGNAIHSYGLKVGVGDVFVLSGQSNIAGEPIFPAGNTRFKPTPTAPYDCISSIDSRNDCDTKFFPIPSYFTNLYYTSEISSNGKNGWFFTDLGNKLCGVNSTPVSFFNAAYDGTSIRNWRESAAGLGTIYYGSQHCGSVGEPYRTLKRGLNLFASTFGVRAVLWQQGEADNQAVPTSRASYAAGLDSLIDQTRIDFNSNLYWLIARTSYYPGYSTNANITNAQDDVIGYDSKNKAGPTTDSYGSNYRNPTDGVHFSYNIPASVDGFEPLADDWKLAINNGNPGRISANAVPAITMTKSGSNYTLSAPNGYDEYRWAYEGDRLDDSFSSSQTLYLTSSSSTGHRCFVRLANSSNWVASGIVYPTVAGCYSGARQGLEEKFEEDLGVNFKVSPNPTDSEVAIEFSLKKPTQVRLDIVDVEGRVVKPILEGELMANNHKYSEILYNLPQGIYLCRLILNGLVLTKKVLKK